mgnify:CR=1 FL=1
MTMRRGKRACGGEDAVTAHRVEIVVRGHLSRALVTAFDGFAVQYTEAGLSRVTGTVADQAMLFGVLDTLDGLNIEVVSVNRLDGHDEMLAAGTIG